MHLQVAPTMLLIGLPIQQVSARGNMPFPSPLRLWRPVIRGGMSVSSSPQQNATGGFVEFVTKCVAKNHVSWSNFPACSAVLQKLTGNAPSIPLTFGFWQVSASAERVSLRAVACGVNEIENR